MLRSLSTVAAFAAVAQAAAVELPTRTTAATPLCSQYAYSSVNGYDLLNNLWGIGTATSGSQCTTFDGNVGSGIAFSSTWTWAGDQNTVKSYIYAGKQFERKIVSQIKRLPTTANWKYDRSDMRANVAYDIFTSTDKDHANSSGDYELMIWLHRYGGIWPITDNKQGLPDLTVTVGGYTWELFTGYNGAMRVYSFLPPAGAGPITNFSTDVKEFFNYLVKDHAFPETKQYMLIYQIGTEAFVGGPTKFTVSKFQADIY